MSSKFREIRPWTTELAALERLKKIPQTYNGENDIIGSFIFLQVMRTIIKASTSLNLGLIPLPTSELAALERLKKI